MPSSRRPTIQAPTAQAIQHLREVLDRVAAELTDDIRQQADALIQTLTETPTPVHVELAEAIGRLRGALEAEFGYDYQFAITARGRTVAAAHTERCAAVPGGVIEPKVKRR